MDRLSDRALYARAATDEAAFAELVNRYREPLRRHAARYAGEADAEDVVQQALVNASLAIRREPDRDIEPKPWLYKVTTNAAIDHRRAQAVRPLGDRPHEEIDLDAVSESPGADPHDVVTGRESVRGVVSGIKSLSPNQSRAATARFLEGRTHDEIASELGVSKGAARELIHRARRNLREAIPALSPVPLFTKLRESLTALFAGSGSAGGAKLAAGAVAVVVAAGAGGVAIENANDGDDGANPANARRASAPVTSIPEPSAVAARPRHGGALAAASERGKGDGGGSSGGGGTGASGAGAGTSAGATDTGTAPASASAPAGSGSVADPVGDVTDQVGVDQVTDQVDQVTDQVNGQVDGVTDGLGIGVDAPDLPNLGQALGGGN
ncbi:MAG TPA: sigma-70 family RNA polymerase sigma factor [Solirubrobacterales bacterium]